MFWTYLSNTKSTTLTSLRQNPLTFEQVDFETNTNVFIDKLRKDYIRLFDEGFFDVFTNDYDLLFVSSYGPNESPLDREKVFDIKLDNINNFKNKMT